MTQRQVPSNPPAMDEADPPRLILRDGSVVGVRLAEPRDVDEMGRFFHDLSEESRYRRFFSANDPPPSVLERSSDSSNPTITQTLIAERVIDGDVRIVAAASYFAVADDMAEVAFAVADRLQGRGLGTALLQRLAVNATRAGFHRFTATALAENRQMLEVFRDSGFEIRSKASGSAVDVEFTLTASAAGVATEKKRHHIATSASIRPLLQPAAVAVVGVSHGGQGIGRRVLDGLIASGFKGSIYPVNPHADEIAGLKTYPSARDLPGGVDMAVIAVPAPRVLDVVDDCALASVRSLVVISAGFAESGSAGRALQGRLLQRVRHHGMRMVGPNCLGLQNTDPARPLNASFAPVFPPPGRIGLMSQSGAVWARNPRAGDRTARRPLDLRQRGQQGRRLRQ